MHSTNTIDLQYVIDGEMDLLLEDGVVQLRAGDSVVIPGIEHAWRTHEKPCTRVSLLFGQPDMSS